MSGKNDSTGPGFQMEFRGLCLVHWNQLARLVNKGESCHERTGATGRKVRASCI